MAATPREQTSIQTKNLGIDGKNQRNRASSPGVPKIQDVDEE